MSARLFFIFVNFILAPRTNSKENTLVAEFKEDGITALIPIIDEDQAEERSKEAQKYTYEVHASDLKADSIDLSQLGISTPEVL